MNKEQKQAEIKKLKEIYKDNAEFESKGKQYHRFVVQEVKIPEELGRPYINIMWDANENKAYVVLNKYLGVSDAEKERKKTERAKVKAARDIAKSKIMAEIKAMKTEIKKLSREFKFNECQDMKTKLDILLNEYKESFGRKRN